MKEAFEIELKTLYPASGDPVWQDALRVMIETHKIQQERVEARANELGIPKRFWASLPQPRWYYGDHHIFEEVRKEMRRPCALPD
ncbi:MAG: hypothetical protein WB586_00120 [Chthoniobacterales bacterium]